MHEFGITSRIVEAVQRIANDNGGRKVVGVELEIGQLTFLNPQQVKFAYDILTRGTVLEGSELFVREIEGIVRCEACGDQWGTALPEEPSGISSPLPLFSCSNCGGKVAVVQGKECQITGVYLAD